MTLRVADTAKQNMLKNIPTRQGPVLPDVSACQGLLRWKYRSFTPTRVPAQEPQTEVPAP